MDPKISKKKNHVAHNIISQTGRPEKNKKYDTSGVLFTGSSGKKAFTLQNPLYEHEELVATVPVPSLHDAIV